MKSNFIKNAGNVGYYGYFVFVFVVGFFILNYTITVIGNIQQTSEIQAMIDKEKSRNAEELIDYYSVHSVKNSYFVGEEINFTSERFVYDFENDDDRSFISMKGLDIYYCKYGDGGFQRTEYDYTREKGLPEYGEIVTEPRTPKVGGRTRPLYVKTPSTCKLLANINLCYEYLGEKICKRETVWSDEFDVVLAYTEI